MILALVADLQIEQGVGDRESKALSGCDEESQHRERGSEEGDVPKEVPGLARARVQGGTLSL